MVQKWTDPNWVEISDKNKENLGKSELAATGTSAPLAKYRHEEIKQAGKEPDPIEMFGCFHVKKDKNWVSSKAKNLHDGGEKVSQGEEPNIFAIYQEGIGPQHPKRVLGMGHGRLGVRLPESFDMDLYSEANGEHGRVGETHDNDAFDDESDEGTADETADAA
ncbi:unnamed protein product [Linum trigynum]|uniref:Uncharacterized protein n=1 Tax=Linum trigynum TaxID=586398 RepID=A0AAV2CGA6_9ROSI